MRLHHMALAILVTMIWGYNFVVIKIGLAEIPPLLFCALRFFLAAFPAVLFIRRPAVPFSRVIAFGLVMFTLQFALLFTGMQAGTTAGLASLILQIQVFFTIALAVVFLAERLSVWQIVGASTAFSGIGLIAVNLGGEISLPGLVLILAAAASWGLGNLIAKKLGKVDMLALVVWSSLVAWPPLVILSFLLEASRWAEAGILNLSWPGIGAVAYIVYLSTLLGFAAWSWLLSRYPAVTVAPFTLLVPLFGFASSALVFGEPLHAWKIGAATLIVVGLGINLFGARLAFRFRRA
ncbi:EamA family transporter [Methylococcus sp. EFPC2]|uniref:EamA family transporter n=1 Tax=Methylococcus sp. EFPC2 TaxID=2812648 RepID=UPI0019677661|nr:EamA family transporter [Methylococcus sp. EFPC2]QSA95614.1 EamA family transporter [Methylococcus sp. EFPC2]